MFKRILIVLMAIPSAAWAFPVDVHYQADGFSVTAPKYEFRYDLSKPSLASFKQGKAGMYLFLTSGGKTYRSSLSPKPAKVHPIRIGRYLTELHVENIVLAASDGEEWPGLGEIAFYCHADRVYVRARLISNGKEWIADDMVAYQAYVGHRDCPDMEVQVAGLSMKGSLQVLIPDRKEVWAADDVLFETGNWQKGSVHEACFILYSGSRKEALKALDEDLNPLPASAFRMTRGKIIGYNPHKGVYELIAKDTSTPEPLRGFYGGCTFTIENDNRRRRILIEQLNNWGGLRGAIIRDGSGDPLPIRPQICINFPELGRHGEPDWGFVIYPLNLKPREKKMLTADHLYLGYGKNDQIMLAPLENVGSPVLMQTSVAVCESHTMTTGLYFDHPDAPHNDLRLNDFRSYKGDYGGNRSVSAVLPSFFRYLDSSGKWHKVVPEHTDIAFEGPVFVDYTSTGRTDDGKVKVTVRTIQMPHNDMTRVFSYVTVDFLKDVSVHSSRKSNIRFAQQYTFNPMVFLKYAYTAEDGSVKTGDLDLSGEIKEDSTPLGRKPFICSYYAPNGLEHGIPCSDITGNPGFVLMDWKARINAKSVRPGLYVFTSKAIADGGDYSRDIAVVPVEQVSEIKAGSKIAYAVENFVFGDVKSDYSVPAQEREAFGTKPPRVEVKVGRKVSDFPVVIRASGGTADFTLTGGENKLAVRVDGFGSPAPIRLYEWAGDQFVRADQGNDWYQCHEAGSGFGFIFLAEPGTRYRITQ